MIAYKYLPFILLLIFILPVIMAGNKAVEKTVSANRQIIESTESHVIDKFENDPVMDLLGSSFDEIKLILGEPAKQGSSSWLGPHQYIRYQSDEGFIQFSSPEGLDDRIAISITMGPGQEIYGARVGMLFTEIIAILGKPDHGPEPGINGHYYMDYYLGKIKHQAAEIFLSFSAADINSPTQDGFIKWEDFEYEETKIFQAVR